MIHKQLFLLRTKKPQSTAKKEIPQKVKTKAFDNIAFP